ncbi:argonaute-like protein [Russula earlei]|uniref:Argonaute-like protein n=1 Tax=Russula earlei TaxID=71964 RepID=A0ACC0TRV6_9AGAM|nr:argonaute-like protein [Russula earlei]
MQRGGDRGRGRGSGRGFRGASSRGVPRGGPVTGGGRGRGGGFVPREQGGIFAEGQPAVVDARLANSAEDRLILSFKSLSLRQDAMPPRPDYGTKGKPIKLRTNFFPIRIPKNPLHEYDVSIFPKEVSNRRMKRRIFQLAEATQDWVSNGLKGRVAHDSSAKLIAADILPQPLTISVPYFEDDDDQSSVEKEKRVYTLTIKYTQPIETESLQRYLVGNPQYRNYDILPVISALNLVLSAHPNRTQAGAGVVVGRNRYFFPSASPPFSLGGGLEAWRGFYSSVRPSFNQLMVNVNVCATAFYSEGNLAAAMHAFEQASFGARMSAFVQRVRIRTDHLGHQKTVKRLAKFNARQHRFEAQELGGMVTVEEYFRRKYKITLQYPNLPLVDVGGNKAIYLPPEVCSILPGQPFRGKLPDEQTGEMIKVSAKPPNVNANAITVAGLRELGFARGPNLSPVLDVFGVSIGCDMAVVPARILTPPRIRYGKGEQTVDEKASWNLRNVVFAEGAKFGPWTVLLIKDGNRFEEFSDAQDPELRSMLDGFVSMCRNCGIGITQTPLIAVAELPRKDLQDPIRTQAITAIRSALMATKQKPALLLVILSNGDKHIYSGLKHLCDVYLDVPNVCVQSANIRKERGQLQYFANVALKVNMKLGGTNHAVDEASISKLRQPSTMLVGMDVTHPGLSTVKGTPSIAAVVASADLRFSQYPASMRIQETKKEMITDLRDMMEERLLAYRTKNKDLPQRILVYRDGVSEGQFPIVVQDEIPKIRASFRKFDTVQSQYRPKLTVVICGKRHHTRFYPTEAANADHNGNPKPGTIVDRGVTAIYEFDFFLQAHGGLQGTTRPTHYYVVCNEMDMNADDLQNLTNTISYTFARATKAVSLAAPAYYADLACERGRCYLHKLLMGYSDVTTTATSGSTAEEEIFREAEKLWNGGVKGKLKESMFYL